MRHRTTAFLLASTAFCTHAQTTIEAAEYIDGFIKTCVSYDGNGEGYKLALTNFRFKEETNSVAITLVIGRPGGRGGQSVKTVDLSDLDPTPEYQTISAGGNTIETLTFNCTESACAQDNKGNFSGYITLPACNGHERLKRAFSALIRAGGGKKSKF